VPLDSKWALPIPRPPLMTLTAMRDAENFNIFRRLRLASFSWRILRIALRSFHSNYGHTKVMERLEQNALNVGNYQHFNTMSAIRGRAELVLSSVKLLKLTPSGLSRDHFNK
jgi:hypothetical protein